MHVAVGILFNDDGQVFIAERPLHKYKGGLWEFPGGKLEPGETALAALKRELKEEIGIEVIAAEPFTQIEYHYEDRDVLLDTWKITQYYGQPQGKEGQRIHWVSCDRLKEFAFPQGNQKIIDVLLTMV